MGDASDRAPRDGLEDREVVHSRVLPHLRERVYSAFADPARLAAWWGPSGFTNEFHEFELRPGGRWRFDMRGPDGARYAQEKTFVEVVEGSRIVLDHAQAGHDFRLTILLDEVEGGTRVTWRMRFASADALAAVKAQVVEANAQNLERLAAHLDESPGGPRGSRA